MDNIKKSEIKKELNSSVVKILTLDGSNIYGKTTLNGDEYSWLSDNIECKDNYKIGKFYNSQRWERYDALIYKNDNDKIQIKFCECEEIPNAYVVCHKRIFRENTKQNRIESGLIKKQIFTIVEEFVNNLNCKFNE